MVYAHVNLTTLRKNSLFCFLALFYVLYWLPDTLNYPLYNLYGFLTDQHLHFLKYIWLIETDIVFLGHHAPIPEHIWETEPLLGYQALISAIIISLVLTILLTIMDQKRDTLSAIRTKSFPYIYESIAKITSVAMFSFGMFKVFPLQFSLGLLPENLMIPAGSADTGTIFWIAYGSSQYYEVVLGLVEIIGAILLWFPKTTILGSFLTSIVLINIVLLDIFANTAIRILPSLWLGACIFLLSPEMKYYFAYFISKKKVSLQAPTYSWAENTHSMRKRNIINRSGLIFYIVYMVVWSSYTFMLYQNRYGKFADPLYGVWDSTIRGVYLGKNSLQTLGILRDNDKSTISLYPFNMDGAPENIPGINKQNLITFTLPSDNEENVTVTVWLKEADRLILHYEQTRKDIYIPYIHRKVQSRTQAPQLVFQY